ncbi:MAG TPA: hypothetical protein PLQ35_16435 [bacterium]|nr:hypothetical protein [bacterium]HQL63866.1 hypothetical protein [bacterium]
MRTAVKMSFVVVCCFVITDLIYLTIAVNRLTEQTKKQDISGEPGERSVLEGVIRRNVKWTSAYTLKIDGNGTPECYLSGGVLDTVADGSHVRVTGRFTAYRHPNEADVGDLTPFPLHWGIRMNVEKATILPSR